METGVLTKNDSLKQDIAKHYRNSTTAIYLVKIIIALISATFSAVQIGIDHRKATLNDYIGLIVSAITLLVMLCFAIHHYRKHKSVRNLGDDQLDDIVSALRSSSTSTDETDGPSTSTSQQNVEVQYDYIAFKKRLNQHTGLNGWIIKSAAKRALKQNGHNIDNVPN